MRARRSRFNSFRFIASAALGGCVALACAAGCTSSPEPGEFGTFRYVGRVRGTAPLALLPPYADMVGNIYTMNGAIDLPETNLFFSGVGGGEAQSPAANVGDKYGAHGWVGFSRDKVWFWSGDGLGFAATNSQGSVLATDPGTGARILFRAVLPWVRDAPSRTSLVALVASPIDPVPFIVQVNLNLEIMTNISAFTPSDAQDLQVIGVGADREDNLGFVLLQYRRGEEAIVEARYYDDNADTTAIARIKSDLLPEYGVRGYLQRSSSGLVVGLLSTSALVIFDTSGGTVTPLDVPMQAVGVHEWEGNLYLVGTDGGRPVIAPIDNRGVPGGIRPWAASERAAAALGGAITVLDDRSLPARKTTWSPTRSAIGDFPFLSPHSPTRHAPDTTIWAVAGPTVEVGGATQTAFAIAPVGIAYP